MATDRPKPLMAKGNNGGDRLLALLQVTNAAFPTGAFTHSYGFETWISDATIASPAEAEARCGDWLRFTLATCDAVAVALAYRCTLQDDLEALPHIDRHLGAMKLSRETRGASSMTGTALLRAGQDIFALPQIDRFAKMVERGECEGHHAVVYGVLSASLLFTEVDAATTFLWSALSSLVAVVQRLLPMGQVDAQRIVAAAGPLIERCTDIARTRELDAMSSAFAALDTASMRHERLYTRLCIS